MKKIILLLLMLSIAGCQTNNETQLVSHNKLTLNLQEGDPPSLNPYVGVDLRSRCLYSALFEPLVRKNSAGELEMGAAESFEVDTSGTVYTFHLRPHRWSNGQPVTSKHFADAWRFALLPSSPCFRADLFYPIKNAEFVKKGQLPVSALPISTPDEQTLIVELKHPTPYFIDLVSTPFYSPLFHPTDEEPTCFNGPFVVKEHLPETRLVFQKNPFYWDARAVQLQEIHFTLIRDPITALAMYEKEELDLVGDPFSSLPFDVIPSLTLAGNLNEKPISRIFYLILNNESYPFHLKAFRRALALSIDRNQLTEHLFFGEIPTLTLLPRSLSVLDHNALEKKLEDPKLLFEAALEELQLTREKLPHIVLSYAELSGQKKLAEFVREEWKKKLGIEVELVCSEWNVHSANLKTKNFQIGTLHLTTLYQDPMFFFELFKKKEDNCNYSRWENAQFYSHVEKASQERNLEERKKAMVEAEGILFDEMPVIPLFTQNLQFLVHDKVDLQITELGIYDFKKSRVS